MRPRSLAGGILLLTASGALVQGVGSADAGDLSLAQAIDAALRSSPRLVAADHERVRTRAVVDRARAAFRPRLDTSAGYARGDQPVFAFGSKLNQGRFAEEDFDVRRLNAPGPVDNFRNAVTLSQPLYTGGRASLSLEQAEIGCRIADLEATRTTQEVVFDAARAYFALRLAQERRTAIDAAVAAAEANLALAASRVRAGLAVESDELAAQVRLARLREEASTVRSRWTVAQAALNDAMGTPLDEPLAATDPLGLRPVNRDGASPDEVRARRPDYRALVLEEEVRERDRRLAQVEFYPSVALEGTYEVNARRPIGEGQGSWSVMAVLRWNLFNGGADEARVREAAAARDRVRALRARVASRIELEVREAWAHLETSDERVRVAEGAIAQAEETLRIVQTRYRNGLTTVVELLGAEAALSESRTRLVEALHAQNVGVAAWELALGRLAPETLR